MLWQNSPLGRLNFLMLSDDAETKVFLNKTKDTFNPGALSCRNLKIEKPKTITLLDGEPLLGRSAYDALELSSFCLIYNIFVSPTLHTMKSSKGKKSESTKDLFNVNCTITEVPKFDGRVCRPCNNLWVLQHHRQSVPDLNF